MKFTLTILAFLATALAQETTSSSYTLDIPGPMEQSVTQLSGTRDPSSTTSTASDASTSTSSQLSFRGPMEQSITTSATDSSSTVTDSSMMMDSSSSMMTTTSSETSTSTRNDATRTDVSQSQDTSAAEGVLGVVKLEQMVMMGLGVGAALAV